MIIGLVLAALAIASGPAVAAKAEASFVDGLGDGGGAPDILSVSVSNDAKGDLTLLVLFLGGGGVSPGEDVQVTLVLDTDKNAATGSAGFDYAFQYDALENTHGVGRWDGTKFALVDAPTAAVTWSTLTVMFRINQSDLGGTNAFDFWVRSHRGVATGSNQIDDAPNDGVWSYTFSAPEIAIAKVTVPTLRPRAGKVLDARGVRLQLSDGRIAAPERLTCRLAAGRTVLKPLRGGCRWQIPQRLRGKTLTLTLVAGYGTSESRVTRRLVVR